ncbi:MAG: DUF368 domain-containing protein [Planctomycetota bacterium]|nr:MAG: DUF368 domain-containing protein [Planctomycetota bacterium]
MSDETDIRATAKDAAGAPARPPTLGVLEIVRTAIAGVLMGIANLIPGVSGGTMVLALGVYGEFIDAVADVTALRFSWRRIVFLVILAACAGGAIVGLSGVILYLLFFYPVAMFSLFIGLTLGGAPLLWRSLRPARADALIAVACGFAVMVGVALLKEGSGFPKNTAMDFVSGVVGATTMVLPGISGSYMLLVMDQYDRVVGAVRDLKDALKAADATALKAAMKVVVPVGIGAIVGIVALSNLLKILLHRYHRATVGVLLGVLLGSVLGLWPFSKGSGEKAMEDRSIAELRAYAERWSIPDPPATDDRDALIAHIIDREVWSRRTPPPITTGGVATAVVMVLVGFGGTFALSRLGGEGKLGSGA